MQKHILLLLVATVLSLNSYAQITFEPGYFIDNDGKKTDCLIKNKDWKNNPIEFQYQLFANDEKRIADIESVREFGISGTTKYIRATVEIDRSGTNIRQLSDTQSPIFKKEELFLKVLIEGKASLLQYEDKNLKRYFYQTQNKLIEQLIYKPYKDTNGKIFQNNQFRTQLKVNLNCNSIKKGRVENLSYTKNKLIKLFIDYNQCKNETFDNYTEQGKKDGFNLTIRPGINISSLNIRNILFDTRDTDFGTLTNFRLGIEAEFIMAFNNGKWSFIIEPTYQYFKSKKTLPASIDLMANPELDVIVNYQSIELPFGARHYFFLNRKSKIFLNVGFVFDVSGNSIIDFDSNSAEDLEINSNINFYFGVGYKFLDRFSFEARHMTNRDLFNYNNWSNNYKNSSLILGYTLF